MLRELSWCRCRFRFQPASFLPASESRAQNQSAHGFLELAKTGSCVSRLVACGSASLHLFSFLLQQAGPICVCFGEISASVFVEIVADIFAILNKEPAIHDLEGFGVDFDKFVAGNAEGAVAAECRLVFGGSIIEESFVIFGGE